MTSVLTSSETLENLLKLFSGLPSLKRDWKLEDFKIGSELASGQFGKVFSVIEKSTDTNYVLKKISLEELHILSNEIAHNAILNGCEYVCSIYGYFIDSIYLYIVMEDCGEELFELLNRLNGTKILKYMKHLLDGLKCIHSRKIIHLDIKPENIVINSNDIAMYIDFGFSQFIDKAIYSQKGTINYMAPEQILTDDTPSTKADIYSLGATFYVMIHKSFPIQFSNHRRSYLVEKFNNTQIIINISRLDYLFNDKASGIYRLLIHMLDKNPETRFSIDQCIELFDSIIE